MVLQEGIAWGSTTSDSLTDKRGLQLSLIL
jgi:hypothetical protein